MDSENLAYAITQIVHNFGAVTVVGGAVFALMWREIEVQHRFAGIVLSGWLVQAMSGATFAAISYYYYAQFPDIYGIALVALIVKVACAAFGILMATLLLFVRSSEFFRHYAWLVLFGLGVLALSSAAVLRWYS